jgi:hypothetical protein
MVGDRGLDSYKTIFFGGILGFFDVWTSDIIVMNYNKWVLNFKNKHVCF